MKNKKFLFLFFLLSALAAFPAAPARAFTIHNDTPFPVSGMLCSPLWGTPIFQFFLEPDQTAHWQKPYTGTEFEVRAHLSRDPAADPEPATLRLDTPDRRVEAAVVKGKFVLLPDR